MLLSSVSGQGILAQSAKAAPTNSADVSAIASAYQVVSATATQLYAGTAYLTSVNGAPVSASRAGNAANASMATSAYYDGTGRLISALPDSATVSAIASSYVESGVSSKQDTLSFAYNTADQISSINGSALAGQGGAQVVTSITTGGYGVREINGMTINASHMVIGAAAANNTSNIVRLGDAGYGAGVFLTGNFGTAYYKVNELQLNRNGIGFIGFNIGGAGSQITATSNAGGKFSAGGTGGARSYYTAFNASASASIEVSGGTSMINIADTGYTSTIYPSSIPYWNGKADSSALSSYALSADVSSTIDTVSSNSASWTQVVTSLSGNANFYNQINSKNISATVSYKARLDENGNSISALYDTVSTQSANWGGSALALSAGPGISLTMVGNTLVISTAGV